MSNPTEDDPPEPAPTPGAMGSNLSGRHQDTLAAIFQQPTRANLRWREVEALLLALGAEVLERKGSRVAVILNGLTLHAHKPHPNPDMKKYLVEAVRDFLREVGF